MSSMFLLNISNKKISQNNIIAQYIMRKYHMKITCFEHIDQNITYNTTGQNTISIQGDRHKLS